MSPTNSEYLAEARDAVAQHKYAHALNVSEILLARIDEQPDFKLMGLQTYELAGAAALGMGEFSLAEEYFGHALLLIDEKLEPIRLRRCQLSLAECYMRHGNLRQAQHLIKVICSAPEVQAEPELYGQALGQLGTVCWVAGEIPMAIEHLEKAVSIIPAKGAGLTCSRARSSLGIAYSKAGRSDDAEREFKRAMGAFQAAGDFTQVVRCLNNLAGIAFSRGDWDRAREYLLDCVQLETETNNRADMAYSWYNLGLIELHENDYKLARKYLNRSYQLAQEVNDRYTEASSLLQLGVAALLECNTADGINFVELAHSRLEGSPSALAIALNWYAAIFHAANSETELAEEMWAARTELADADSISSLLQLAEFIVSGHFRAAVDLTPKAEKLAAEYYTELCELSARNPDQCASAKDS